MNDCSLKLDTGVEHTFKLSDLHKAVKYAFEHDIAYIKTPYGMLSLIDNETYENVMYFNNLEMQDA